jgi:glycosyltransferase involved in cell wall biosynthesis
VHVRRLTDALSARGHRVRVIGIARRGGGVAGAAPWPGPPDGAVEIAPSPWPRLGYLALQARTTRRLEAELRSFRPDVFLTRVDPFPIAPFLFASRRRLPLCVEVNGIYAAHHEPHLVGPLFRFGSRLERLLIERAEAIGAPSSSLVQAIASRFEVDRARVHLVPNGTMLPPLDPEAALRLRRQHGAGDGEFLLAYAGNLSSWQTLPDLLAGLATLSNRPWRLWIVGEGAGAEAVQQAARRVGMSERVDFLGSREEEEAARLVQAAQILVAPYGEDFLRVSGSVTLKVLQALACDRPILVSALSPAERVHESSSAPADAVAAALADSTPLREAGGGLDRSRFAGELIHPNTPQGWADSIVRWMDRWELAGRPLLDWPWRAGDGPGRRIVASERSWDRTARSWEEAMRDAIDRAARMG